MKKYIQVLVLSVLLYLSEVSATRELSTNGVCYIEQCGCPDAFLANWCGDASQLADPWCQISDSNCGNCAGVWCQQDIQEQNQQQQDDSGKGTCYIEQCGCPGEFKLHYCSSENVLPQGFCQESEVNCGNCDGVWCGGSNGQDNNTDNQNVNNDSTENNEEDDDQGVCYISQCGCPDAFKLDYCNQNIHKLPAGYCQESKNNCVNNCDGAWCNQQSKRILTSSNGRCFIGQCGCPGNYYLDWCNEENQLTSPYCTASSENCELCDGVWCDGDNQKEQEEEKYESDAADEYICFIGQCGCPGSFLLDYCNETNVLPEGYCQYSENNCVQNCGGAWCKA